MTRPRVVVVGLGDTGILTTIALRRSATALDTAGRRVHVDLADGSRAEEVYDVVVIATGVTNGFWRHPPLRWPADITAELDTPHRRLARSRSVAVIGGGAAAVSAAAQIAQG